MRGEYAGPALTAGVLGELPPRARRIHHTKYYPPQNHGTTSACAENTPHLVWFVKLDWNYLRVRGEYGGRKAKSCPPLELPPRARRIHQWMLADDFFVGTTSACAENTARLIDNLVPVRNYLRVRGEYPLLIHIGNFSWELPPRARRIHQCGVIYDFLNGTTSACAENTIGGPNRSFWFSELPPRARRIHLRSRA